ncbi:MAG: hypothetical protein ABIP93_15830 [Gemmatimonadaceae bacterium]
MHVRSRSTLHIALAAGLVLGAAARPAEAQQAPAQQLQQQHEQSLVPRTPPPDVAAPARTSAGPTMDAASVAVRQPVTSETRAPNAPARRAGYGRPVALMAVGGAALLAGLIIGDGAGYAIAVGGAVIGLYGLYEYLQ